MTNFIRSILVILALVSFTAFSASSKTGEPEKPKKTAEAKPAVEKHQCEATTKKGTQCKHNAIKDEKYCKMHKKMMEKEAK